MSERLASARERGESISIDIAQDPYNLEMFLRYAERYGGRSASAMSLLDSELARQGPRPTTAPLDASSLPSSFDDVRARFSSSADEQRLNPDLSGKARTDRKGLSSRETPVAGPQRAHPTSPVRSDVQAARARVRDGVGRDQRSFDNDAEVERRPDGTTTTRKSLLLRAGKQVADDATTSVDQATEAVRKAQGKKR